MILFQVVFHFLALAVIEALLARLATLVHQVAGEADRILVLKVFLMLLDLRLRIFTVLANTPVDQLGTTFEWRQLPLASLLDPTSSCLRNEFDLASSLLGGNWLFMFGFYIIFRYRDVFVSRFLLVASIMLI